MLAASPAAASATTGNSQNKFVLQALSLTNSDLLKICAAVQQIITELSEALSEKDKIMVITKIILNETKWLLEFIGNSKS
jgi:hypothetical protein